MTTARTKRISENSRANLKPWKPGQSGNPNGRPKGSRDSVNETFLEDALEAWHKHGKKALKEMATKKPADFVRMYAGLMPKEKDVTRRVIKSVRDLSQDELRSLIDESHQDRKGGAVH